MRAAEANRGAAGARNMVDAAAIGRAAAELGEATEASAAFARMSRLGRMDADEQERAAEAYAQAADAGRESGAESTWRALPVFYKAASAAPRHLGQIGKVDKICQHGGHAGFPGARRRPCRPAGSWRPRTRRRTGTSSLHGTDCGHAAVLDLLKRPSSQARRSYDAPLRRPYAACQPPAFESRRPVAGWRAALLQDGRPGNAAHDDRAGRRRRRAPHYGALHTASYVTV